MKFLMTYQSDNHGPPSPEHMAALGKYTEEMLKAGVVVMTGGIVRANHGIKLRLEGDEFAVTDGPHAETKELIDGYAVVEAKTPDEAIARAQEFMRIAGEGKCEILRLIDFGPAPH